MSDFANSVYTLSAEARPIGEGRFGAKLISFADGTRGVLKVAPPLTHGKFRGVQKHEMSKREVAAYRLDLDVLHFGVVPETVLVSHRGHTASVQKYYEGSEPGELVPDLFKSRKPGWADRVLKFDSMLNIDDMVKIIVFDLIINNVDRNGKNLLMKPSENWVKAIDNGSAFGHAYEGYRSVFHRYLFYEDLPIPSGLLRRLSIIKQADLAVLAPYLPKLEIQETWLRIQFVLEHAAHLDWKTFSGGASIYAKKVPTYDAWFTRRRTSLKESMEALLLAG